MNGIWTIHRDKMNQHAQKNVSFCVIIILIRLIANACPQSIFEQRQETITYFLLKYLIFLVLLRCKSLHSVTANNSVITVAFCHRQ